jgi:CTP-dependent riboflavin kinase
MEAYMIDIKKYLEVFDGYSYNNELFGRGTLHLIMGRLLVRHKKFLDFGYRTIDPRCSLTYLKPTASGGSSAFDFVKQICDSLSINVRAVDEATDAALIGTDEVTVDEETGEDIHTPKGGLFGNPEVDIIYIDEGSVLFQKNPPQHSSKTRNYIQKVLNPMGSATSKLVKEMAHVTIARDPDQSMYVVSFYPEAIDSTVIRTGFMQRSLTICKRMGLEDRKVNMFRDIDLQGTRTDKTSMVELIESFKKTEEFIKATPTYTFGEGTKELQKSYVDDALNTLTKTSAFLQEEGASFVQLYVGRHFPVLSWHHSIARESSVIETEDVKYAYMDVLRPAFLDVVSWIEEKSEVKKAGQVEKGMYNTVREAYLKLLESNKCVMHGKYISKSDLSEELQNELSISERSVERLIKDLHEKGKMEKVFEGRSTFYKVV